MPPAYADAFVELDDSIDELLVLHQVQKQILQIHQLLPNLYLQQNCKSTKQVFNLANNIYSYEEAQKVCAAFDASLATYDQVEAAYDNGAEW